MRPYSPPTLKTLGTVASLTLMPHHRPHKHGKGLDIRGKKLRY